MKTIPIANREFIILMTIALLLSACAEPQPQNIDNACDIFSEKKAWYDAAISSQERWNIPVEVTLAFIHQESSFRANAKPPRGKLLGFIPWFGRVSSASGYAQALDASWSEYKKETGRWYARRSNFKHSADFIGWYNDKSARTLNLSRNDAYSLYLAYHEGRDGFKRKTYNQKPWLLKVANKVKQRTADYRRQLASCAVQPRSWLSRWMHFDFL
ncbi:MAG: hypothetical protein GDA45_01735 [Chromatiales bacterium]|nr:hypothetical protein [Chromatiales bacterium]